MSSVYHIDLFDDATDDELAWLIANSREVLVERGAFFLHEGDPNPQFYITLEGELQVTQRDNGGEVVLGTTPRGIIGGEIALLLNAVTNVSTRAIVSSRLMVFDRAQFRSIFTNAPTVGAKILLIAAERLQNVASRVKQQEKMAALGKLSAGLAHELNNPAAAATRAAQSMRDTLQLLQGKTLKLAMFGLSSEQVSQLIDNVPPMLEVAATTPPLSTLERSDCEDTFGEWLEERNVGHAWELAATFVNAGLKPSQLETLTADLPPKSIPVVFGWLHAALTADSLLRDVEVSTRRISELVTAIKAYTYMDQGAVQDVDLHQGLENTLKVLGHKLKNVTVVREYDPALPVVTASGSELNQVWTNLIDNAIDAMHGKGTLKLITRDEQSFAMVEVTDSGPGIPEQVLPRIFEPFFTTKGVGSGTGLGLDIVYRIIRQHNGTIEVQSRPGETRFIVRLPHQNGSL
jgi:signal transduction histidine kinase